MIEVRDGMRHGQFKVIVVEEDHIQFAVHTLIVLVRPEYGEPVGLDGNGTGITLDDPILRPQEILHGIGVETQVILLHRRVEKSYVMAHRLRNLVPGLNSRLKKAPPHQRFSSEMSPYLAASHF
jgi:hypothetical protein